MASKQVTKRVKYKTSLKDPGTPGRLLLVILYQILYIYVAWWIPVFLVTNSQSFFFVNVCYRLWRNWHSGLITLTQLQSLTWTLNTLQVLSVFFFKRAIFFGYLDMIV